MCIQPVRQAKKHVMILVHRPFHPVTPKHQLTHANDKARISNLRPRPCLLVLGFFHRRPRWALCQIPCRGWCGVRTCGLRRRRGGYGLLVRLLVVGDFLDVAGLVVVVVVLVLRGCESALLALGWLAFAICLCGEFGGFLFFLGELLVLYVLGCLVLVSSGSDA